MEFKKKFTENINCNKGSVVALVYTFEGETAKGFQHYDFWRSRVIGDWIVAVEEIGCLPYVLDVRTFIMKASMDTLPHLDYVVNLNAGNKNLDNLGLIPSICSFMGIPCIPCSAKTCLVGEDKIFANMIANNSKLTLPKPHPDNMPGGIIRDRSFGSSIGIRKTSFDTKCSNTEISQEFILGTDMTIPVLFNPCSGNLETLPPIVYRHNGGSSHYLDANAKRLRAYTKSLASITEEASDAVVELAKKFDIYTFCRVDTRVINYSFDNPSPIALDDIYFIEINPTPTIHNSINFAMSVVNISNKYNHYMCWEEYKDTVSNATFTGYILTCSIQAIKAMRCQLQD